MLLELQGVSKSFPGVRALEGVSMQLAAGEVHVLLGENGAGKSTLVKMLAGVHRPDAGTIELAGKVVALRSQADARRLGISVIHQELSLAPHLTAAENIFLGRLPTRPGLGAVDWRRVHAEAARAMAAVGLRIDPDTPVRRLSVAERQLVEIARALSENARILIMDEPTATLSAYETERLFDIMRKLREQGTSIIYISHRLEEAREIGDRATVLRDGTYVGTWRLSEVSIDFLISQMVGRSLAEKFPPRSATPGAPLLEVQGLARAGFYEGISFTLHRGEVLGIAGLVGAGRTSVARSLFGLDPPDAGAIHLRGRSARFRQPQDAIAGGVALIPEDRKDQGLVLNLSVLQNSTLASINRLARLGWIPLGRERSMAEAMAHKLSIVPQGVRRRVRNLSGGNQQKVVIAKWLLRGADVFIFDEPTRGVDVGAKVEIYRLINALVEAGSGVILISSELPEILGMCDRMLVMREGRVVGERSARATDQEDLLNLAFGQTVSSPGEEAHV